MNKSKSGGYKFYKALAISGVSAAECRILLCLACTSHLCLSLAISALKNQNPKDQLHMTICE
jgi:hypothetical protein